LSGGVVASGSLVAREEAIVAAEVQGFRVASVKADVGDQVTAGQVLVQLDDTLLRSQIDQQTALVSQADVAARQTQASAQRVNGLDNSGAVAKEQIDQRRFQAESAAAAVTAQRAGLKDLQTRAGKMEVKAPVSGVITERNVRAGELSGGAPMFRIVKDNVVELSAEAPESALRAIQRGAPVSVTLPNGQTVQGRVRMIEPSVRPETHMGQVRITLPVRADLRPGGSATAQFSDLRADVLTVPETAVNYDADGASVFVVGDGNRVSKVAVETGRRGGGYAEIVKGVLEGQTVLRTAGGFVLEGDVITPQMSAPPR
ncbi:MAG: efflux RND transporter periplasmic adaptor subunit, partial [Alphaproteobacteria bacterium]